MCGNKDDMVLGLQKGDLRDVFEQGGYDPSLVSADPDSINSIDRILKRLDQSVAEQIQLGTDSVEALNNGRRLVSSAVATQRNSDKQEKDAKRRASAQLFSDMLQQLHDDLAQTQAKIDDLDDKIERMQAVMEQLGSGEIDVKAAMQDEVVKRAIREWEARNGKKFDENADNAQDVLQTILADQMQVDGVTVEGLQQQKADILNNINDINQKAAAEGITLEVKQDVDGLVQVSTTNADLAGFDLEKDELQGQARITQDVHSDNALDTQEDVLSEDIGFDAFSALDAAGENVLNQFQTASSMPRGNASVESVPIVTPTPTMQG